MTRRSVSLTYLWYWGAILIVLGAGGLLLHPDFSVGSDVSHEHLFGLFETNGWHSVVAGDGGVALGLIPVDLADTVLLHLLPGLLGVACAAVPEGQTDVGAGTEPERVTV